MGKIGDLAGQPQVGKTVVAFNDLTNVAIELAGRPDRGLQPEECKHTHRAKHTLRWRGCQLKAPANEVVNVIMPGLGHGRPMSESLELQVGRALRQRGWTLALGESCTGGLVAHRITEVAGSSEYFLGGVVAYSNPVKQALLRVSEQTLESHGAVSEETALEMARGARAVLSADVGLSVTGIAGPGGGTPEKPVGLTVLAVSTPAGDWAERHVWGGDRQANKQASAEAALQLLLRVLSKEP